MTPSGIEPATFRFVAQCLNQQRYHLAPLNLRQQYVAALMDQEILKVLFYDVRCAVDMHFSAWSAIY